jgi:F-type H+-transporting ATPase subunit epsilon
MSLKVIVYTPTKIICNTLTEEVVLPTLKAEMSIRPYHKQIMGVLPIGLLRIKEGNKWKLLVQLGGIAEFINDKLTIFVRNAEEIKSIDLSDVEKKLNQAEEQLKNATNDQEKIKASENLQRLSALLKATPYI